MVRPKTLSLLTGFLFGIASLATCLATDYYCLVCCIFEDEEDGAYLFVADEFSSNTTCDASTFITEVYVWEYSNLPAPEPCGTCLEAFPTIQNENQTAQGDKPFSKLPDRSWLFGHKRDNSDLPSIRVSNPATSWTVGFDPAATKMAYVKTVNHGNILVTLYDSTFDYKKANVPTEFWPKDSKKHPVQTKRVRAAIEMVQGTTPIDATSVYEPEPFSKNPRKYSGTITVEDGTKYFIVTQTPLF